MITEDKYSGNKYNRLTILGWEGRRSNGLKNYIARCECGNTREVVIGSVVHNQTTECKDCAVITRRNNKGGYKHGQHKSGLYQSWKCMKSRCKDKSHPHYSKLNITYCSEWESFEGFQEWAMSNGWKEGLTIDRIDPEKGYFPDNCQWLTRQENSARANRGRVPWNKS